MLRSALLLAFALAPAANATIVTIDPDSFDNGTILTNVYPGVTIKYLDVHSDSGVEFSDASVIESVGCHMLGEECWAATGSKLFSELTSTTQFSQPSLADAALCFQHGDFCASAAQNWGASGGFNLFLVEFHRPTDYVQISGTWIYDWLRAYAFDSNFEQVAISQFGGEIDYDRCSYETNNDWCANTVSVESSEQNISWMLAGSWSGIAFVDDLKFRSVPEPGTFSLLCLGVLGLMTRRPPSRRTRKPRKRSRQPKPARGLTRSAIQGASSGA